MPSTSRILLVLVGLFALVVPLRELIHRGASTVVKIAWLYVVTGTRG